MTDGRKHIVGPTERREEIARIIDPTLWRALDFRGALPEGYREHALASSLAKADAILASDGEGVTSRLPEGWVAVPIEATEEMKRASMDAFVVARAPFARQSRQDAEKHKGYRKQFDLGVACGYGMGSGKELAAIWKAMLAAAPPLPEPTQDGSPQQTSASDGGREMVKELVEALGAMFAAGGRTAGYSPSGRRHHWLKACEAATAIHAKAKEWLERKG